MKIIIKKTEKNQNEIISFLLFHKNPLKRDVSKAILLKDKLESLSIFFFEKL